MGYRSRFDEVFGIGNGATLEIRGADIIPPNSLTAQTKSLELFDLLAQSEIQWKGNGFDPN